MPQHDLELVIVSPTGTSRLDEARRRPANLSIRHLAHPLGSRGQARNAGFRLARGRLVYFNDQDVYFPRNRLPDLAASLLAFAESSACLATGPYLSNFRCTYWGRRYNWLSNLWLFSSRTGVRFLAGNCLLRKGDFKEPVFDESLTEGGEEAELSERIESWGRPILCSPAFAVVHVADHDLEKVWLRWRTHRLAKRRLKNRAGRTLLRLPTLLEILSTPMFWDSVFVWMFATLLPIRRALPPAPSEAAPELAKLASSLV